MKLRVDTSGTTFLCAGPPEPVVDFDSKAPRITEDGRPLFSVSLVALSEDGAEVFAVKVAGEPKGIVQGSGVKVSGLVASPWTMGDRSGVAFRADKVEVSTSPTQRAS